MFNFNLSVKIYRSIGEYNNMKTNSTLKLIPVMLAFFAMGFVDLVGIASNYLKADLGLSDSEANIFPSLVFFWFLIFSVPTGMLMNRVGRKKTVLLSLVVTFLSLLIPIFDDSYMTMLVSFSLLGIGNALMQTSLNPLLSNIVSGDKLASSLTFGQFVKAIASFLAPYIAMWGATGALPLMGLGWRALFPVYMVIAVIAIFLLGSKLKLVSGTGFRVPAPPRRRVPPQAAPVRGSASCRGGSVRGVPPSWRRSAPRGSVRAAPRAAGVRTVRRGSRKGVSPGAAQRPRPKDSGPGSTSRRSSDLRSQRANGRLRRGSPDPPEPEDSPSGSPGGDPDGGRVPPLLRSPAP